jgi:hypothetical protein
VALEMICAAHRTTARIDARVLTMANPRVSIASLHDGSSGIGHIAHQAALGIHREGWLERLFVSTNAQSIIPGELIRQWGLPGRARPLPSRS